MRNKNLYLHSVEQLLIGKRKDRKAFLNNLSQDIDEYLLSTPDASCTDLEKEFGTPAQLLYEYASAQDERELVKSISIKRISAGFLTFLLAAVISGSILNTLWWNKTLHDIHETENYNNQIGPTIIIDRTEESKEGVKFSVSMGKNLL